jgi:predicted enzyme related to lactoylglutathione lyase
LVEIYVDDMEPQNSMKLYWMLRWRIAKSTNDEMKMMTFLEIWSLQLLMVLWWKCKGVKAGGNSTLVYFGSSDCITEEQPNWKASGKIFRPKMSIENMVHYFIYGYWKEWLDYILWCNLKISKLMYNYLLTFKILQ